MPSPLRPRHSHAHLHTVEIPEDGGPRTATGLRRFVLVALAVLGALTIVGLIALWPDSGRVHDASANAHFATKGTTFPNATIEAIKDGCPGSSAAPAPTGPGSSRACQLATVKVSSGDSTGKVVTLPVLWPTSRAGLAVGDQLKLMESPSGVVDQADAQNGKVAAGAGSSFTVYGVVRSQPLLWWAIAFIVVVLLVGALRGLMSLVALVLAGATIAVFTLPSLISGSPGLAVGLCSAAAIMFVVIYLAHGISIRSSVALLGTLCGVAMTAGFAQLMVVTTNLSGVPDQTTSNISVVTSAIDFRGLLTCALIIAGLGALNDITITQTSAVWELRTAAPAMRRAELFVAALRIGRDHIASTIYTIVFAYTGTALAVLVTLYLYAESEAELLTGEDIATEVVRILCSSMGLLLAMPLTTALAVFMLPASRRPRRERDERDVARGVSSTEWSPIPLSLETRPAVTGDRSVTIPEP